MLSAGSIRSNDDKYSTSRNGARLARLSSRWNYLRVDIDRDKQFRKDTLEDQLLMLYDFVNRDSNAADLKIKQFKDRMRYPEEKISELQTKNTRGEEYFRDQLREAEESTQGLTQRVKQELEDYCTEWNRQTDSRIIYLCGNLEYSQQKIENTSDALYQQMVGKLVQSEKQILQERQRRYELTTQVTEEIEGYLNRLHGCLQVQKKVPGDVIQVREETQSKLFKMIEEINTKLQDELKSERHQRYTTKAALTRLLEETCRKVELNFR